MCVSIQPNFTNIPVGGIINNQELERRAKITNEQCNGIQPPHLMFYSQSIHYSADRCLAAFERYDELVVNGGDAFDLISVVQEAIGHAAALSKYFWPSSMGDKNRLKEQIAMRQSRGTKLREHFGITDTSPLFERSLRNTWEHFDEKLDTYVMSNDAGYFFPSPLIGSVELVDEPVGHIFKLIDPQKQCLVLLGKKFFFQPIREEVERIFKKRLVI